MIEINNYKKQVELLLSVLPEVAKESCFALHGGTAINLFIRDMPRLSVDIDLTYIPIEDRTTSLQNIKAALNNIKSRIESTQPNSRVQHKEDVAKLMISTREAEIKVEVNLVGRGLIESPIKKELCTSAQNEFDIFTAMTIVPFGQLYGGKICAALDRQHPRDLFDIKWLLENEGFTEQVKSGFLLALLSSDRPIHEILNPQFQDHRQAMQNQFQGMSKELFTYHDFEQTRQRLVDLVNHSLKNEEKKFLMSVKNAMPEWTPYDFFKIPGSTMEIAEFKNSKRVESDQTSEII